MYETAHHGCSKGNIDGTNRLIKKADVCSMRISAALK